jgi:hypothetical protein
MHMQKQEQEQMQMRIPYGRYRNLEDKDDGTEQSESAREPLSNK